MIAKRLMGRVLGLGLLGLLLAGLTGCRDAPRRLARPETVRDLGAPSGGLARITIYLEGGRGSGAALSLRLAGLEIGSEKSWERLPLTRIRLNENEVRNRQLFIGSFLVEPGGHRPRLRLELDQVTVNHKPYRTPDGKPLRRELAISQPLSLEADSSTCIFLDWPAPGRAGGTDPLAGFAARLQSPVLARDQVSVLCRDIGTVYFVNPDRGRVTASLGLPGRAGESAFDPRRLRFYVVGRQARALFAFDAASLRRLDSFTLPLTQAPASLALDRNLENAFVSDTATDRILKLDLDNGFANRQSLKVLKPGRLFTLRLGERDYLAVVSARERSLTLLDPNTLAITGTISVDGVPAAVAGYDNRLYVADRENAAILVYTFPGGQLEYTVRVGRQPSEIILDNRRFYIANRADEYLSLLLPRQRTTLRRIPGGSDAVDLAISRNWRKLYIANHKPRQLTIVDLNSGRMIGRVRLGGSPDQVTIWER